jgi:hypothetical protein
MPSHRKTATSVDEMIANLAPDQREIVETLRALVSKADPQASEGFKWSMPVFEHDGMLCYIAPMKTSVNFGFYESAPVLDDADGLLEGTGKRMRHVKLSSANDVRKALFTKWVKQAAAFNAQQKGATSASRETGSSRAPSASRAKSPAARAAKSPRAK